MTAPMPSLAALPEFELGEWESEFEYEGDLESEEFFRQLAGLARRAAQNPMLRRVGLAAARHAIAGIPSVAGAFGAPGSLWSDLGQSAGGAFSRHLLSRLPEREWEYEGEWEADGEWEYEWEAEVNPIKRAYPDALMEHLGHAATEAEYEEEAEAFIGALVPLAARLIPRVAPSIMRAAPQLIRGVANVTRALRSNPSTRPLVRAVPAIVQRTAQSLADQARSGRPLTAQRAVQTLARQTARTLSSPRQCVGVYRRSRALDQRYHQAARRAPALCR